MLSKESNIDKLEALLLVEKKERKKSLLTNYYSKVFPGRDGLYPCREAFK